MTMNKDQRDQLQQGMQRHEDLPREPMSTERQVSTERPDPTRAPAAPQQGQGTPHRGPAGQQQGGQPSRSQPGQQGQSGGGGGQQGGTSAPQEPGVKDDIRTDLSRDNPYKS
ncbi:hypothetical protein [Aquabacter sediminis]|uniref:hypothetical protein n=1 Tax=Aquabacter sediminis TaxID=3029197 RepID=UPI00237E0EBB|nr:hypothetical protein [Aquabacter sp. P-9]MDE1566959.1 hypothetical protein [Aquabacter sp. P-9]